MSGSEKQLKLFEEIQQNLYYPIAINEIKKRVIKRRLRDKQKAQYSELAKNNGVPPHLSSIKNQYNESLIKIDGEIPIDLNINNEDRFLFISYDQSRYTHGIHKYPAKFFPELPRWIIQRYSKPGNLVLDPFSGSGTTSVEALLNKRNSIGIDVDPLSRLLLRVKVRPIDIEKTKTIFNIISNKVIEYSPSSLKTTDIPDFPYRDSWFRKEILEELSFIRKIIKNTEADNDIREFLLVSFSSIIRSVSNADDNCTRTVVRKKLKKNIHHGLALSKFIETLSLNIFRMEEFVEKVDPNYYAIFPEGNDARAIDYPKEHFDLALTSPPYVNAVDYPRTHQLELY